MSIGFNCPHCGKDLTAEDEHAGKAMKCTACGQTSFVPEPIASPGIRIEAGGLSGELGTAVKHELPPGRFRLAEATCRVWKKGGLSTDKTEYPVECVGLDGLTVLYGAERKPGTIISAPRRPAWDAGTSVAVALLVGAFANPLRFAATIASTTDRDDGPGCRVDLKITEASEDVRKRLQMLNDNEDLRRRRRTGMFGLNR